MGGSRSGSIMDVDFFEADDLDALLRGADLSGANLIEERIFQGAEADDRFGSGRWLVVLLCFG
jgi:hypothetical protein